MTPNLTPAQRKAILGLLGAIVALIVAFWGGTATDTSVDAQHPEATPTAKVTPAPTVELGGRAGTDRPATKRIPQAPAAVQAVTDAGLADHAGLRDQSPPGVSRATLSHEQNGLEDLARGDQLPLVQPDAAPAIPGCTSRFVRNYSMRGGVRPRLIVLHYTVSHNVTGWADVWSVVHLFDVAAYQASSNFVIDGEGHCAYIVRDTDKAWAQAAANPYAISIENVDYGTEGRLSPAQARADARVVAHEERAWGIPNQLGAVSGCLPTRSGVVDHGALGSCGGGHHDLRPFYGTSVVPRTSENGKAVGAVLAEVRQLAHPAPTSSDRRACRGVHAYRLRRAHHLKATRAGTRLFNRRLAREHTRGFRCVNGKVKRR